MFYSSFCAGGSSADGKITSRRRESHLLCSPLSMNRVAGKREGLNQMTVQTQHSGASSGTFFSETSMLLKPAAYCRFMHFSLLLSIWVRAARDRDMGNSFMGGTASIMQPIMSTVYKVSLKVYQIIIICCPEKQKKKTKKKTKKKSPKGTR